MSRHLYTIQKWVLASGFRVGPCVGTDLNNSHLLFFLLSRQKVNHPIVLLVNDEVIVYKGASKMKGSELNAPGGE